MKPSIFKLRLSSQEMNKFINIFGRQRTAIIGMVHVRALPGSPMCKMTMDEITALACHEAKIYQMAKIDAVLLENMHDVPYQRPGDLGPETVASMSVVAAAVRRQIPSLPIGIQMLSSGNNQALAIAKAAGLNFIRAEGWVFAHVGDEGYNESCAAMVTRYRRYLSAENVLIFTDIKKKHSSHAITADVTIATAAMAAEMFCSDGVIVTGSTTGVAASQNDLKDIIEAVQLPVLVGSGVTIDNVDRYCHANGLIVGSYFKRGGHWANDLDVARLEKFMARVNTLRDAV